MKIHNKTYNKTHKHKHSGFTLIEILIVLFIISIVTSMVFISVRHNENKQLETFTKELTQVIQLAEEEAILKTEVLGISIHENKFRFSSLQTSANNADNKSARWLQHQDNILGERYIPNEVAIEVKTAGNQKLVSMSSSEEDTGETEIHPQIIISSNGDATPFIIYIGKKGQKPRYAITSDGNGQISNQSLS